MAEWNFSGNRSYGNDLLGGFGFSSEYSQQPSQRPAVEQVAPPPQQQHQPPSRVISCDCAYEASYCKPLSKANCYCRAEVFHECKNCTQLKSDLKHQLVEAKNKKRDLAPVHKRY
jgi:hypothetical protein